MTAALAPLIARELATPEPAAVHRLAQMLADPARDVAMLYYGSTLRTGDLSGILDFYRLTERPHRRGLHGLVERVLWPEVSYHEIDVPGAGVLRAKVATMTLAGFSKAAAGRTLDTTIWARFVQPARLVWTAHPQAAARAGEAVCAAVQTASRFAASLGPDEGEAMAFWTALFRKTYAAEFRVEDGSRADLVATMGQERFEALLAPAWSAAGVKFAADGARLVPEKRGLGGWTVLSLLGKPRNLARLAKAAFTFEGAARYAAWKIERHTGLKLEVTPFRERHPILAAPGVLLRLALRPRRGAGA